MNQLGATRQPASAYRRRSWYAVAAAALPLALVWFYLQSALLVFDFSSMAYPYDEETRNGQPVACGPQPRWLFCRPDYHNFHYTRQQWPFVLYRPLCKSWLALRGYADAWR